MKSYQLLPSCRPSSSKPKYVTPKNKVATWEIGQVINCSCFERLDGPRLEVANLKNGAIFYVMAVDVNELPIPK